MSLTSRQAEILDYIRRFIETTGVSPRYVDIMDHFGFKSYGVVTSFLRRLERAGAIRWEPKVARGIRLTRFQQEVV